MKKISQMLLETEVIQVTGRLARYNVSHEITGKCAMGVLACESGDSDMKLEYGKHEPLLDPILIDCKLPKDLDQVHKLVYRYLNDDDIPTLIDIDMNNYQSLGSQIINLNDALRLSFKEIGEYLEVTYGI